MDFLSLSCALREATWAFRRAISCLTS
uniref:Uncharacterized protein n=1 Tax=Rhizophora mucronata TaxID=61149 RepID=A0A2P2IJP1_RHIMU